MNYIYTGDALQARSVQSPQFQKRGIEGLTTGKLEDLDIVGVPGLKQLAYDGYLSNLPAFLKATAVGAKVGHIFETYDVI
jgi:hypothetical protein